MKLEVLSLVLRLDCLSCVLTIFSTILVGRRCWEGWVLAAANSLIICVIGLRTAQLGFIPANLFCIVLMPSTSEVGARLRFPDQRSRYYGSHTHVSNFCRPEAPGLWLQRTSTFRERGSPSPPSETCHTPSNTALIEM